MKVSNSACSRNASLKYKTLLLTVFIALIPFAPLSSLRAEGYSNDFGINYYIEDEETRDLFYAALLVQSYINETTLIFNGRAEQGILAFVLKDAVKNGRYNTGDIDLSDNDMNILKSISPSQERCSVHKFNNAGHAKKSIGKSVVIFNSFGDDSDDQLKCLLLGTLVGLGSSESIIREAITLSPKDLIKFFITHEKQE